MLAVTVDTSGLTRMEKALTALAREQLPFALSRALNDCAQQAGVVVNKAMPEVFDRPIPFTDRAAIAPRDLAATRDHLVATVTLLPKQAAYLLHEEIGGTRTPGENSRKPAAALVLPGKSLPLNEFGNIPDRTLQGFRARAGADLKRRRAIARKRGKRAIKAGAKAGQAKPARANSLVYLPANLPGNKAHIGGYFRRLEQGHLARLTAFEPETHYHARMGYHARVAASFARTWATALPKRLAEAIATAR